MAVIKQKSRWIKQVLRTAITANSVTVFVIDIWIIINRINTVFIGAHLFNVC